MGSSLSIVNNTEFEFVCKVGPDESAGAIAGYIFTGIAAVASIIVTAGAAAPVYTSAAAASVAANSVVIPSITTAIAITQAAASATVIANVAQTAAGLLGTIVAYTINDAITNGYRKIDPGQKETWDGFTLSLWQQGHCRRTRTFPAEMKYITDEIYMRPIFSGATDKSNLDHNIQFWINKWGFEPPMETAIPPPHGMTSWGDVDVPFPTLALGPVKPPGEFVCNICGDGFDVLFPDATVSNIPNTGVFTCADLDRRGKEGTIDAATCPLLLQFLGPCGCPQPQVPGPEIAGPPSNSCVCPQPPTPTHSPDIYPSGKGHQMSSHKKKGVVCPPPRPVGPPSTNDQQMGNRKKKGMSGDMQKIHRNRR